MKPAIRSVHIADSDGSSLEGGGAEIVFDATIRAAHQLGHDVTVFTAPPQRTPLSYVYSRRVHRAARNLLDDVRPSIIHLQNFYHYLSPSVLAAIRDHKVTNPTVRVVFTAHDFHLISPNSGFQHYRRGRPISYDVENPRIRWFHRFDRRSWAHSLLKLAQHVYAYRVKRLHNAIDVIISPSQLIATALRRSGVTTPINIVRNPIFVSPAPPENTREGLAFLGRLTPAKGLLQFVTQLEALSVACRLDVYGDGPQRDALVDFASRSRHVDLALHGHIRHEDISAVLTRHRALVYPSTWLENAPLAVVEAASLGLTLVVPHQGGAREMAELSTLHEFYDPTDATSIEDAVRKALATKTANKLRNPQAFLFNTYVEQLQSTYAIGDT
ncbi:glycosyltransferase [Microbacterium sp. NPDC058342]|uniref:glycosyltransferase n=1 Tax=Microbacterium sp. NPDC058342 TaxID=3346454 RepID=UPI00365114BC